MTSPTEICAEQRTWDSGYRQGLLVCPCGQVGVLMEEVIISESGEAPVRQQRIYHNYFIMPLIVFDPDATAAVDGHLLGPGLHRSYERTDREEHISRDGVLVRGRRTRQTHGL